MQVVANTEICVTFNNRSPTEILAGNSHSYQHQTLSHFTYFILINSCKLQLLKDILKL